MRIKAIIVAYSFLVQYFKNAIIMGYVGLRVKTADRECGTYCMVISIKMITVNGEDSLG